MPKKRKLNAKHAPKPRSRHHHPPSQSNPAKSPGSTPKKPPTGGSGTGHKQHQHDRPTIPFSRHERILLLGEGDLSFAASLVKHHRCGNVVATVFEKNEAELLEKYPHARANLDVINAELIDAEEKGDGEEGEEVNWEEDYGSGWEDESADGEKEKEKKGRENMSRVVYNIDATKPFPASISRPPPDRIIFNFPHVGGLSTDVNRQVRANQSLLVSFFESALKVLSPSPSSINNSRRPSGGPKKQGGGGAGGASPPSIVVTLFESEPYTLWNIRDLGRHCGLQVERSFRFQADAYPGYKHARTCGVIRGKDGKEAGWKGEERSARSYVFVRKDEDGRQSTTSHSAATGGNTSALGVRGEKSGKRKRGKGEDDSDSD